MMHRTSTMRWLASAAALLLALHAVADPGSPDVVIESAVAELTEKLDGRKDELAADRDQLYALINDILLPRFDRNSLARARA